jgi:hypothetical protein
MSVTPAHPAPHRARARAGPLLIALMAGPAAWIVQLTTAYGVSSFACDPSGLAPFSPAAAMTVDRPILFGLNLVCLALAGAGGLVALRGWRRSRDEKSGGGAAMIDVGEGRTRFLAACGVLTAVGFSIAILFNTFEFFSVPACWSSAR